MTHSLQTYASALRAMGLSVRIELTGVTKEPVGIFFEQIDGGLYWTIGEESPYIEAAVRSAVLKIAPGSYAFPRRKMGVDSAPIRVNLCDAEGEHLEWGLGKSSLAGHGGATYTEAWLNSAVALVEAGMVEG